MLTHGELFAGISGFGLGFERAGMPVRWAVEIEPDCRAVLRRHHPEALILDDVREVGARNLPPVDVISFGSPCQDLSVAGRRKGLDGARSGLFFEATRIIGELRPTYAIWENVPGALSSNAGRDFGAVLDALAECGAVDISWRMLDAQYFGLAQRRLRLFLVASFRAGVSAAQVLFAPESGGGDSPPRREAGQGAARGAEDRAGERGFIPHVHGTLNAQYGKGIAGHNREGNDVALPQVAATLVSNGDQHRGFRDAEGLVAFAQNQRHEVRDLHGLAGESASQPGMTQQTFVAIPLDLRNATRTTDADEQNRQGLGVGADGDPSPTLSTLFVPGVAHSIAVRGRDAGQEWELGEPEIGNALRAGDGGSSRGNWALTPQMAVRRLTPTECERLQGFPDGWTAYGDDGKPISDSARYMMLGNAAPVPVVMWIARRIIAAA